MEPTQLLHLGEELIYDLFGVVFFAFLAVTLIAFRRPLLSYCSASFVVASVLWVMTTVFNLGYMLPQLVRAVGRLERALRLACPDDEARRRRQAMLMYHVPKRVLASLVGAWRSATTAAAASGNFSSGSGLGAVRMVARHPADSFELPPLMMMPAGVDGSSNMSNDVLPPGLVSSGVTGCLSIMTLVCVCSALLIAVSVGMVLEADAIEQEYAASQELARRAALSQMVPMIDDKTAGGGADPTTVPLISGRRHALQMPHHQRTRPSSRWLKAAVWVNQFVGIEELRYTGMYHAAEEERDSVITPRWGFVFALPRAVTRVFLRPSGSWLQQSRRPVADEEAADVRDVVSGCDEKR